MSFQHYFFYEFLLVDLIKTVDKKVLMCYNTCEEVSAHGRQRLSVEVG